MRVVALIGLVLVVREGDGNAARLFFRRVVDLIDLLLFYRLSSKVEDVENGGGERRLAVVDVPDGAYVDVRLASIKCCHTCLLLIIGYLRKLWAREHGPYLRQLSVPY